MSLLPIQSINDEFRMGSEDKLDPELEAIYQDAIAADYDGEEEIVDPDFVCDECGRGLPAPEVEDLGAGYSQLISYCRCGATYLVR